MAQVTRIALSEQQVAYFDTFGFLYLPGLFAAEAGELTAAFEEVFDRADQPFPLPPNPFHVIREPRDDGVSRLTLPDFIDAHPGLSWLRRDPRVRGIVRSLLGPGAEFAGSDGNLFYCDVLWHLDAFGSLVHRRHIKLYFYLDALREDTGALRVLPGTGDYAGDYVQRVRTTFVDPDRVRQELGLEPEDVPGWTIEVNPGDLVVGNYRTFHAAFGGGPRRRLFTVNYREASSS